MKKRILSILLCCVMLAGMLPSVAFAEGGTGSLTVTINGFQVDNIDFLSEADIESRASPSAKTIFSILVGKNTLLTMTFIS